MIYAKSKILEAFVEEAWKDKISGKPRCPTRSVYTCFLLSMMVVLTLNNGDSSLIIK